MIGFMLKIFDGEVIKLKNVQFAAFKKYNNYKNKNILYIFKDNKNFIFELDNTVFFSIGTLIFL